MPSKPAKIVAVGLVALAGLAGVDLAAREAAAVRLGARLAAVPGLHVARIEVAPLGGTISLRSVSLGREGNRLTIGMLRLPLSSSAFGLAQASADPVAPAPSAPTGGTLQAEDVSATIGATTVRIKRIEIAGTKLTDADLKSLLDDKAPDGLEARLRKLTATAVVVPEIVIDDSTRGAERHALVKKVLLAGVAEGKASAFSAAETSLALTSAEDAVNGTTGGVEAANIDLAQLARVVGAKRADTAEAIRPLFDKLQINSPKLVNVTRGATIAAARIAAAGVGARPLDRSLSEAAAVAVQAGSSAAANALLLDEVTQSVAIASLDVDDASSQGKAGGEETSASAQHIGVRDVGARGVGAIEMRGFKMEGDFAKVAVGTVSLGPVPLPGKTTQGDARPAARPSQIDLGAIAVDITPRDKPASEALRFKVEHAAVSQEGGPTAIPASGSATIDKLTFEAAPEGVTHTLYDMGYRGLSLSATLSSTYDAGAQELTVRKLSVNEPAMGSAEVALHLAGVSQDLLSPDAGTAQMAAIGIVAKSIELDVVNAGLAEKAIEQMAKRNGMSVAEQRAYYVELVSDKLPVMFGDGPGAKALGAALGKFMAAPKSLHISIASKDGLGVGAIGMLGDPAALLESLDIKASAND